MDIVFVVLGANDLNHEEDPVETADRILRIAKLYTDRGVAGVVVLSVGGAGAGGKEAWPEYEQRRQLANQRLVECAGSFLVVDCDPLTDAISDEYWIDEGWHLTQEGYDILGDLLADSIKDFSEKCAAHHDAELDALQDCPDHGEEEPWQEPEQSRWQDSTGWSKKSAWAWGSWRGGAWAEQSWAWRAR